MPTLGQVAYEAAYTQLRSRDSAAPSGDRKALLSTDSAAPGVWAEQNDQLQADWEAIAAAVVAANAGP